MIEKATWNLQNKILENLKEEVKKHLGPRPLALRNYYNDYKKAFYRYLSFSNYDELISDILHSDIVYCGDYHTLREAQMTNIKLLNSIIKEQSHIIIAMESFLSKHQHYIDKYMENSINEEHFLSKINYKKTFGFDWENYKPILEFAKQNHLKVIGLDVQPYHEKKNLDKRDNNSAKIIAHYSEAFPGYLLWVIIGDLHLAINHLPAKVNIELKRKKLVKKKIIIYQNSERLYKKLLMKDLVDKIDLIKVRKNAYCVMNTPPWIKYQSYINWMEYGETMLNKYYSKRATDDEEIEFSDDMAAIITTLADFFNLPSDKLLDFTVYTLDDIDFLSAFAKKSITYQRYKKKMVKLQNFVIPEEKILYLAKYNIDNMAELAAMHLYFALSQSANALANSLHDYFSRNIINTLSFFCSKILNYKRSSPTLDEMVDSASRSTSAIEKEIVSLILMHKALVMRTRIFAKLRAVDEKKLRYIARNDYEFTYSLSEIIGKILGSKLYYAFQNNNSIISQIKGFFFEKYNHDEKAFNSYLSLRNIAYSK